MPGSSPLAVKLAFTGGELAGSTIVVEALDASYRDQHERTTIPATGIDLPFAVRQKPFLLKTAGTVSTIVGCFQP